MRAPFNTGMRSSSRAGRPARAFTVIELMVVVVCVALLAALLLPGLAKARQKSWRIHCTSNLKQVGLATRLWAGDNGDHFPPMSVADVTNVTFYFRSISNEIVTPSVLACPADPERTRLSTFTPAFTNANISYFVGLDTDESHPDSFLAGDRNLTNGLPLTKNILTLTSNSPVSWTAAIHHHNGNIALSDGSVQQFSDTTLRHQFQSSGTNINRLLMP